MIDSHSIRVGRRRSSVVSSRSLSRRAVIAAIAAIALSAACGCANRDERPPFVPPAETPYRVEPWRFGVRDGHRITTDHYVVYTTVRDASLLDALPRALETTYAFLQYTVPTPCAGSERMQVYLFANRDDWVRFTRATYPEKADLLTSIRNGGYTEGDVAVIEYVAHQVTGTLLAHEAMHQYLHHCARQRVPAWLNEGLAVLCEGQRWHSDGLADFDPSFNPSRRNALAESLLRQETFPLSELLRINAGHVVGGPVRDIAAYYAQVWALLLFLREGDEGRYAAGLDQLLEALGDGRLEAHAAAASAASETGPLDAGTALFTAFISPDIETVDREYHRFMRQRILGERVMAGVGVP